LIFLSKEAILVSAALRLKNTLMERFTLLKYNPQKKCKDTVLLKELLIIILQNNKAY